MNNVLIENDEDYVYLGQHNGLKEKKNHGVLDSIRQTPGYILAIICAKRQLGVQCLCGASYDIIVQRPGH